MINQKFENYLETTALEFLENKAKYKEIISIHHTDADGISSGAIIKKMLERLGLKFKQYAFNLDVSWKNYIFNLGKSFKSPCAIIFSDLEPSGAIICDLLEKYPNFDIYIIDHHLFKKDPLREFPENVYNCNPTLFGLNGLKEIVGVTLNYLFAREIDERNKDLAWLAAIGMGGDTLDHINNYKSYNKLVIEEALELGQIELHKGICAFGGQFERLDKALSMSILPYIPSLEGDRDKARILLQKLNIDPKLKITDLNSAQINNVVNELNLPELKGEYITFPKKKGILHHVFEYAALISIVGHDNPSEAFKLLTLNNVPKNLKIKYYKHNNAIVSNLTTFLKLKKIVTKSAIFVDLTNKIDVSRWSNIGSFATINKIYDEEKALFIGGMAKEGNMKFSVRCSQLFIKNHNGKGTNAIIKEITNRFGGSGGGHGLAGGMRIDPENYPLLTNEIDDIINSINNN
nr:DHH family protein [Candidatus Prometheoarchaeum syntrophicum]